MCALSIVCSVARMGFLGTLAVPAARAAEATSTVNSTSTPNRTPPKVEPFKAELAFPAEPGPEDIFRARVFEEPLVLVGGEPSGAENAALAAALLGYAKRSGPDDFSSLTAFLDKYPASPWRTALLTDLGLEYYHTAHYSLAADAWRQAWTSGKAATDGQGKAIADRAVSELAYMYARLGRMDELEALLKSVEKRPLLGSAAGRISGAREGLWTMQNRPEIAFRCGPLALRCIRLVTNVRGPGDLEILNSASTQKGFSLPQVAELSGKVGLNYQMAFRGKDGEFVVPSVVHWKVGHYAAMVRKEGNRYQLQDPTFGNSTWATKEALEAETSGYFLVPQGALPAGWRSVDVKEGATVWGKGQTGNNDPQHITKKDISNQSCPAQGMAVPSIHMMDINLDLKDQPVGYTPPVGPPVRLVLRYNQREVFQPANFSYSNFGYKWTCDWITYLTDTPTNLLADVNLYVGGGGQRTFTGFDTNTQTYAYQQYDRTLLKRTGPGSYELLSGDGSKLVFNQSDGSVGSTRNIFMTQMVDPQGNAVTLTYDANLRIVAVTDAIGQVTTLTYGIAGDIYKITQVTDPFGRSAIFGYEQIGGGPSPFIRLVRITDVIGLTSQFLYNDIVNGTQLFFTSFIKKLTTPYGDTLFNSDDTGLGSSDNTRFVEITYPDSSRERVEYTQTNNVPPSDPPASLPTGMLTHNSFLMYRNTYYWDRTASALGYRDYSKARLFHWLHTENLASTAGALESTKQPLEGRVWYDYPGQSDAIIITANTQPAHVGRVLDDGSTQLRTYAYNGFGQLTNSIDPLGRTFSFLYATNGIDLLEVRQTRAGNNELLWKATYNSQHRPLTVTDASGQTGTYTYNARGQLLTATDPKNETITYSYDNNGYLIAIDGALPGTNDVLTAAYDSYGRIRTLTDVSGYTPTFDYDNLDRLTLTTYPDGTFSQNTYDRLDLMTFLDRAGRQTSLEYDNLRQLKKKTDPLGRVTRFEWCRCGALKSLTDPMGRTTSWLTDVQGRRIAKQYSDGSQVRYFYENATSRLRQIIDEQQQATFYAYNLDNTFRTINYKDALVPTPGVSYTYDPDYERLTSVTDGTGTTTYGYGPITPFPSLTAGRLASVDGPLPNDTIVYAYDEVGRRVQSSVNGVGILTVYDAAGRVIAKTNALGSFSYAYDGSSRRVLSVAFPNGQTATHTYGDNLHDRRLQQITYTIGTTPLSQFIYGRDIPKQRITSWSQQAGAQPPSIFNFGYDAANQLLSATVTNAGVLINSFGYGYDAAGNRLTEQTGASNYTATYNALNELSATTAPGASRTNEWDAAHRLSAVNSGNRRTEFTYDGQVRMVGIRQLVNGSQVSRRRFVWCDGWICEERDASGANVTKRYFPQGMKVETGPAAGAYYYTRDHLGSIRELTDGSGNLRARYAYDPFGRKVKVSGDVDADFGFAGMFWSAEANLDITRFRAYDPELGRWLSRDPLAGAEMSQGPNLYAYVRNEPVGRVDPAGLCTGSTLCACVANPANAAACTEAGIKITEKVKDVAPQVIQTVQNAGPELVDCGEAAPAIPQVATQVSQVVPNVVNAFGETVFAATQRAPPGMGELMNELDPASENLPLWVSDRMQAMDDLANELHSLPYWNDLDFDEMKIMWEMALTRAQGGNEDFWAYIGDFLNNLP